MLCDLYWTSHLFLGPEILKFITINKIQNGRFGSLSLNWDTTCRLHVPVAQNTRIPRNETDMWNENNGPGFFWKLLVTETIVSASF